VQSALIDATGRGVDSESRRLGQPGAEPDVTHPTAGVGIALG